MISQSSGRHRLNMEEYSAEEEALSIISEAADIRLAAKKAVIVEAKEILLKEIEKRLKESELEPEEICKDSARDAAAVEGELRQLEKKYKAAMVNSAQLDSENQSLVYQVETLKDQLEEREEEHTELQRHYKEKCREYDFQKRDFKNLEQEMNVFKQQLEITSRLLAESGFIILVNDRGEPVLEKSSQVKLSTSNVLFPGNAILMSSESRNLSKKTEEATPGTAVAAVQKSSDGIRVSRSVDEVDGSAFANVSDLSTDDAVDGSKISSNNKLLVSQHDIVSEHQETESSSLGDQNVDAADEVSGSTSTHLEVKPNSGLVDDEADEFFDAVSTPSPSTKTSSYDELGVYDQNVLTGASEGSSVDPEIRIKETPTYASTESERQSIRLENVTETESSTDIIDESEEQDVSENITEAECKTDTYQNEIIDADPLKEVIEGSEEQSVLLETSGSSKTEVGDFFNEESANVDRKVEEATSENKRTEESGLENGETGETLKHVNKDSQEDFCDIPQDAGLSDAVSSQEGEVADVQNISDITQLLSCEVLDSNSVVEVGLESNVPVSCLLEETLHSHTDKQEEDGVVAEEKGDTESVEISEPLGAEGTTEVRDTEDVVEEAGITESIADDREVSSVSVVEALNMPSPTESLPDDVSEKPDSDNIAEKEGGETEQSDNIAVKEGGETEQLSQSTHSLETENKEGDENFVSSETEGGDSKMTGFDENTSCSVEHIANDNIEGNECAEDTDYPVRDSSKLVVRTASIGGSEASEGAVIDDYDLEDIDDVLSTDAQSPAGADLNTAPNSEAELPVLIATEPLSQDNNSNARSPSKIDVEMDEGSKAKGSKKNKSEKGKAGKKSGTEKAEKIKSGEKESKDKAEKTKHKDSKEKTEKSKSSKKDSSHEKKVGKSKGKKDVSQESKRESVSGEEDKHSIAESVTSLEPDDLEGALDKQMLESEMKSSKKSSKKMSIFKKVFK